MLGINVLVASMWELKRDCCGSRRRKLLALCHLPHLGVQRGSLQPTGVSVPWDEGDSHPAGAGDPSLSSKMWVQRETHPWIPCKRGHSG